jgi:hypothetical protein
MSCANICNRRTGKKKESGNSAGREDWKHGEEQRNESKKKTLTPQDVCSYKFGRVQFTQIENKTERKRKYEVGNVHEGKVVQRCNGFCFDA